MTTKRTQCGRNLSHYAPLWVNVLAKALIGGVVHVRTNSSVAHGDLPNGLEPTPGGDIDATAKGYYGHEAFA